MKRTLLLIFAAIIVAATAAVTVVWINSPSCSDDANEKRAPIEDMFAVYIDIEQLVDKGAIENYITPEQRRMIATMASANIEDPEVAAYIKSVITDLSQLGLNLSQPAYVYGNYTTDDFSHFTIIVEVVDVAKLDRFFNTLIENGNTTATLTQTGDNRIITGLDSDTILGYNSTRLAVATNPTLTEMLPMMMDDALARPLNDLSIFGNRDIAAYIDVAQFVNLAEKHIEAQKLHEEELAYEYAYDYEVDGYNATIAEYDALLEQIAMVREYYSEDATIIAGLTFDEGRATIDVTTHGVDTSRYTAAYKRTSNVNLQYVEDDVLAVINMGIKGDKLSELIDENMPENAAEMFQMSTTEFNIFMGVVLDMLTTIDGDTMVALTDLGMNTSGSTTPNIEAIAMFDVTDNYIYSMATQYGLAILHPAGDNLYSFRFPPFTGYLGQQENILFASLGAPLTAAANPATECNWYNDIAGSYSYILIDVENLMQSEMVSMMYSMMLIRGGDDMQVFDKFVQISDYIYLKLDEPNRMELSCVLKDKDTNALQQIIEQLMVSTGMTGFDLEGIDSI